VDLGSLERRHRMTNGPCLRPDCLMPTSGGGGGCALEGLDDHPPRRRRRRW
jgi:hypothetical protein